MSEIDVEELEDKLTDLFVNEANRILDSVATAVGMLLSAVGVLLSKTPGFDKERFFNKFDVKMEGSGE